MDNSDVDDLTAECLAALAAKAAADVDDDAEDSSSGSRSSFPAETTSWQSSALSCVFTMVFSATCISLLVAFGLLSPTGGLCPEAASPGLLGIDSCSSIQDFRALARIAFFPVLCCIIMHGGSGSSIDEEDDSGRQGSRPTSLEEIVMAALLL